jgi:YVTN family beta-propeller protein
VGSGLGLLLVAEKSGPAVVPINLNSGEQTLDFMALPARGAAIAVAVSGLSVWVGVRASPGLLIKFNPDTAAELSRVEQPLGVQDIAGSDGYVWVLAQTKGVVVRVDTRTRQTREIAVGQGAPGPGSDIAVGEGAVWVTNASEDTVTRIDLQTLQTKTITVGDRPQGIGVGGGTVWVANRSDATVSRLDPRTGDPVGEPIDVDAGPSSIAVVDHHLWVGSLNTERVQRIDF